MKKPIQKAFTLIEVLAAVLILAGSITPVILYAADSMAVSREMEQRVKSTLLAQAEMEKIKNTLRNAFSTDFTAWSTDLGNGFRTERTSTDVSATLKKAQVSVGYDTNGNASLDAAEILITLTTQIVERN